MCVVVEIILLRDNLVPRCNRPGRENRIGQSFWHDRPPGVVHQEALAHDPGDARGILEERVDPRIGDGDCWAMVEP